MNERWLEDYLSLVETGNFTRSAEQRFSDQSAFSRRIRSLEDWAGAELFNRNTQPISLTAAGEVFLPFAKDLQKRIGQSREAVMQCLRERERSVKLAATHSLASSFYAAWLRDMEFMAHGFEAIFYCMDAKRCFDALDGRQVDIVICHVHPESALLTADLEYESAMIGKDSLVLVCAPRPGTGRSLFTLDDSSHYLAYLPETSIGRAIARMLGDNPQIAELQPKFRSEYASILKSMAIEGHGFAWLPRRNVEDALEAGALVRIGDGGWDIPVEIRAFRVAEPHNKRLRDLWALIEQKQECKDAR